MSDRRAFISVEEWGDEGGLYVANGHHSAAEFIAAVRAYMVRQLGEFDEADYDLTSPEWRWITYTIPTDSAELGQYVDHPWDSEQVCLHYVPADTPGAWPVTVVDVQP